MHSPRRIAAAAVLLAASAAAAAPAAAVSAAPEPACPPKEDSYLIEQVKGPYYKATGPTKKKLNSSGKSTTISYSELTDHERTTYWKDGSGKDAAGPIRTIEALTGFDVVERVAVGTQVTGKLKVPAERFGAVTAAAGYRDYSVAAVHHEDDCSGKITELGILRTIVSTSVRTCTAAKSCSPLT